MQSTRIHIQDCFWKVKQPREASVRCCHQKKEKDYVVEGNADISKWHKFALPFFFPMSGVPASN